MVFGVIGVELHGGESFGVKLVLVLVPAVILAVAAWKAATIARESAYERQREQLDRDADRQREQLKHDTARQETALAHDRQIRDRERLRTLVGKCFDDSLNVQDHLSFLQYHCTALVKVREKDPDDAPAIARIEENWNSDYLKLIDHLSEVGANGFRLKLLLGSGDPIVSTYFALWSALRNRRTGLQLPVENEIPDEEWQNEFDLVNAREESFELACRTEFG